MKFAVGYPVHDDEDLPFVDVLEEFHDQIGEVYFAWPGEPSGRSAMAEQDYFLCDLTLIRNMGIRLDLLLNANCYGPSASSRSLAEHVIQLVQSAQPDVVTTASPFIARVLKDQFPSLELRASVNLRLGTVQAFQYLADVFDSFYLQRDFNRDFDHIRDLKTWCDANGKTLLLLANSGCLRFCGTQTYHDNLVAHEKDIAPDDVAPRDILACRSYLRSPDHWPSLLQATWIRPEDLHHYEPFFPLAKLATRLHVNPSRVLRAYTQRRYPGNLLDLLEPGHRVVLQNHLLDNTRFPADWFHHTTQCNKKCHTCDYCRQVLNDVLCAFPSA